MHARTQLRCNVRTRRRLQPLQSWKTRRGRRKGRGHGTKQCNAFTWVPLAEQLSIFIILSVFRNTVDIAWASSHVFIVNLQYPSHCGVYYHTYIIGSIALGACKSTHTKNTIKLTAMLANTCLLRLLHPPHFDNASPVTTDDPSSKRGIYTRQCSNTILMRL